MTKPLFDVFRDAMERKPTGSRKEALDQFVAAMKSDPKYLEDLATDYFHRMSAAWTVRDEKHGYSFGRVVEPSVKIEEVRTKRAFSAERTATALETLKAKIRDVILKHRSVVPCADFLGVLDGDRAVIESRSGGEK